MTESTSATRVTIWLSLAAVALTAAVASYLQALTVVQAADGTGTVTYFVAALADPTLFAASVNILDSLRRGRGWPAWSAVSVGVALAATIGANVMAGSPYSVPSWLVRVWPPVAFLMALESLMSYVRRTRGASCADRPGRCPHGPAASKEEAVKIYRLHARDCLDEPVSNRQLADRFGVDRNKVAALVSAPPADAAAAGVAPPDGRPSPSPAAAAAHPNGDGR